MVEVEGRRVTLSDRFYALLEQVPDSLLAQVDIDAGSMHVVTNPPSHFGISMQFGEPPLADVVARLGVQAVGVKAAAPIIADGEPTTEQKADFLVAEFRSIVEAAAAHGDSALSMFRAMLQSMRMTMGLGEQEEWPTVPPPPPAVPDAFRDALGGHEEE